MIDFEALRVSKDPMPLSTAHSKAALRFFIHRCGAT